MSLLENSTAASPAKSQLVDDTACDNCGQFGALEIAGRQLCPDCVSAAGCGCGGLGGDEEIDQ